MLGPDGKRSLNVDLWCCSLAGIHPELSRFSFHSDPLNHPPIASSGALILGLAVSAEVEDRVRSVPRESSSQTSALQLVIRSLWVTTSMDNVELNSMT